MNTAWKVQLAEKLDEIEEKKGKEREEKKLKERDEGGKFTTQADKGKTRDKVAEKLEDWDARLTN